MYCYYSAVRYDEDKPFTLYHVVRLARMMIADHVREGDITLKAEVHIWHNPEQRMVALVAGDLGEGDGWVKVL